MSFTIRQIRISKYGPLEDCKIKVNPTFQCIFGPNESGKTLIIDAVLKMALPSKLHSYLSEDLRRVDGKAHGWLMVDVDGEEHELSDSKDAHEILPIELENLRDLLVVRNSDLHNFNEAGCLNRATDLMMGLRTDEIQKIENALKERGQLTQTTLDISSAGGLGSAGKQLELAKKLHSDIEKYIAVTKESGISGLETEIIQLTDSVKEKKKIERELLEAQKLAALRKLEASVTDSDGALGNLDKLEAEIIEAGVKEIPHYLELEHDYGTLEQKQHSVSRWALLSLFGFIILGIVSQVLNNIGFGIMQSFVMVGIFIFLVMYWWTISKKLDAIAESRKSIISRAKQLGSDAKNIEKAIEAIRGKNQELEVWNTSLTENIGIIKSELELESVGNEKVIALARQEIATRRKDIDQDIDREYDEKKFNEVRESIDEEEERLAELREKLRDYQNSLAEFKTRFSRLRFEKYLERPAEYNPDSIESLSKVQIELEQFISSIEKTAKRCATAVNLFDELAKEEERKISELLSRNSRASEIFSKITENRYSEITYMSDEKEIRVMRQDGSEMQILNLSKGTKDQMYLAIRLALAEKVLGGKSGFFLLDDPFITSDLDRRAIQIEALEKMIEQGWQVLYFTANENLAGELKSRFKKDYVTLLPLK